MKVVLFCGGSGMRIRDYSESIPKPLVPVGNRPILWHVMKYYAHYGHKDFILCLGWKGNAIKEFFLKYNECESNDFVMHGGEVTLLSSDIQEWTIRFVDTGLKANVGERLLAVKEYLVGEETFLCNYADGVSDLPLDKMLDQHLRTGALITSTAVRPSHTFHLFNASDHLLESFSPISDSSIWMNGGFYAMQTSVFDYMQPGEDLVAAPLQRLVDAKIAGVYKHSGFWACMDTFKEKQILDDLIAQGSAPWEVWK